jgi:hypothetical protein
MTAPWEDRVDERDGVWAYYVAWELWLREQMPDYAAEGFENAEDDGAWKENLYAIMDKLAADVEVKKASEEAAANEEVK